jgi:hypothetical protein
MLLRFQEAAAGISYSSTVRVTVARLPLQWGPPSPSLLVPSLSASRKHERERDSSPFIARTFLEQIKTFEVRSLQQFLFLFLFSFTPRSRVNRAMATKSLRSFHPLNRCLQNATAKTPARIPHSTVNMSTIASFKTPKVSNEPNVSLAGQVID